MASSYEYILSLNDNVSGKLQKITGNSYEAVQAYVKLQGKSEALQRTTKDFGNSIYNLKQKIDLLQQERDLIDPSNLTKIRQYNREIKKLNTQVTKLETINGSKFKRWGKDAFSQMPGIATNPIVLAGTAMFGAGKMALGWEEGMAKVNATAQLSNSELNKLGGTIRKMGVNAGANLQQVPDAYEKILSQTEDVSLSTDILEKALKGAKAGFTDVNLVGGALAQTLSVVGKENANAQQVIDTLFTSKRVGAGEFQDFARYVPILVAAGQNIGAAWNDSAGLFAFMTGKGQTSEMASTLIQNIYTALGKTDIQKGLQGAGINIFDEKGALLGFEKIMQQVQKVTGGMSDQQRSNWLEAVGLRDAQAKNAFSILASDVDKLSYTLNEVRNPAGELDKALNNTKNSTNRLKEAWSKIQDIGISLGGGIASVLNPALSIASPLLNAVGWTVTQIGAGMQFWFNALEKGNPLIWGLTAGLTAYSIIANKATLVSKVKTGADMLQAFWTKIMTAETWALNTAMLANPAVWVAAGVAGLVAGLVLAWKKSESFRKTLFSLWEVMKIGGKIIYEVVIGRLIDLVKGIGKVGKAIGLLFKKDFKGAAEVGKSALLDLSGFSSKKRAYEQGKQLGAAWKKGQQLGAESWEKSNPGVAKERTTKRKNWSPGSMLYKSPLQGERESSSALPGQSGTMPGGATEALAPENAPVNSGGSSSPQMSGGRNVTVNISKVGADNITLHTQNVKEGVEAVRDQFLDMFLSVLNGSQKLSAG